MEENKMKTITMNVTDFNAIIKKCLPIIDKKSINRKMLYICITETNGNIYAAATSGFMVSTYGNKLPDNETTIRICVPFDINFPKEKYGEIIISDNGTNVTLSTRSTTAIGYSLSEDYYNLETFYPKNVGEYTILMNAEKLATLLKTYDKEDCLTFTFYGTNSAMTIETKNSCDLLMPMLGRKGNN